MIDHLSHRKGDGDAFSGLDPRKATRPFPNGNGREDGTAGRYLHSWLLTSTSAVSSPLAL